MADQINVNAIANTLQTKVDLPDGVSQGQCDFVIARKSPTAQDPTWYRRYKSGWVEQGGYYIGSTDGWVVQPLLIPMRDTNYSVTIERSRKTDTADPGTGGLDRRCFFTNNYTTTSFNMWGIWATYPCSWEVKGFAATTGSGEGDESTLGNVYKTYFYNGTDLDYANAVGPYTVQQMAAYLIPKSGAIVGQVDPAANTTGKLKINDKVIWGAYHYQSPVYIQVKKGDVFSYENLEAVSDLTYNSLWFVPYDESSQSTDITITTLINAIYPIGSIYIGTTINCPIASIIGTWEKIDENLVLQSSSQTHQAGTTIAAGLPNATGYTHYAVNTGYSGGEGVFSNGGKSSCSYGGSGSYSTFRDYFDLSRGGADPIYGKSDTVQPPAYVVNIWKRIA